MYNILQQLDRRRGKKKSHFKPNAFWKTVQVSPSLSWLLWSSSWPSASLKSLQSWLTIIFIIIIIVVVIIVVIIFFIVVLLLLVSLTFLIILPFATHLLCSLHPLVLLYNLTTLMPSFIWMLWLCPCENRGFQVQSFNPFFTTAVKALSHLHYSANLNAFCIADTFIICSTTAWRTNYDIHCTKHVVFQKGDQWLVCRRRGGGKWPAWATLEKGVSSS